VREKVTDFATTWLLWPAAAITAVSGARSPHVNESIVEMQRLLKEIVGHLQADTKADKRKAAAKLERMASLASTVAQMLQAQR
jgi:hypothetical protein